MNVKTVFAGSEPCDIGDHFYCIAAFGESDGSCHFAAGRWMQDRDGFCGS